MLNKNLALSYYYNSNGTKDEIILLLSNCFAQCTYLILKNKYQNVSNPYSIFLEDITICISQYRDDSIKDIWTNITQINREMFFIKEYKEKGKNAVSLLESLIDKEELVIVQSVNEKLPFSKFYNENFKIEDFKPRHAFLTIGYDENYIYFVESPELLNIRNFTPYIESKEVGLVSKDLLEDVFNDFCTFYTITINNENFLEPNKNLIAIIEAAVKNYYREDEILEDTITSFGQTAIKKLIEICNKNFLYLNHIAPHGRYFYDFFDWKIRSIINGRKLLIRSLMKYFEINHSPVIISIEEAFENSIHSWEKTFGVLTKRYYKENYLLGSDFQKYFEEILRNEDRLVDVLKEFLGSAKKIV